MTNASVRTATPSRVTMVASCRGRRLSHSGPHDSPALAAMAALTVGIDPDLTFARAAADWNTRAGLLPGTAAKRATSSRSHRSSRRRCFDPLLWRPDGVAGESVGTRSPQDEQRPQSIPCKHSSWDIANTSPATSLT